MNARIRELQNQAGFVRFSHREDPHTPIDWSCDYTEELNRFAELIVNECIHYCGENLSKTVGGALKIHLGVDK